MKLPFSSPETKRLIEGLISMQVIAQLCPGMRSVRAFVQTSTKAMEPSFVPQMQLYKGQVVLMQVTAPLEKSAVEQRDILGDLLLKDTKIVVVVDVQVALSITSKDTSRIQIVREVLIAVVLEDASRENSVVGVRKLIEALNHINTTNAGEISMGIKVGPQLQHRVVMRHVALTTHLPK